MGERSQPTKVTAMIAMDGAAMNSNFYYGVLLPFLKNHAGWIALALVALACVAMAMEDRKHRSR
jgi:hypothetical protein